MAASVGWYDTDDTTELTTLGLGAIPPGEDYFTRNGAYAEVRAKNDGDEALATAQVEIQQAGAYDAYEYLRIATGAGSPGAFQDHSAGALALGALAVGAVASVWVDAIVPSLATPGEGQVSNLVLLGTV